MLIRAEKASDIDAIDEITRAAFRDVAVSRQTEQFIIKALRADRALAVSLVAEIDGRVVGHVAFSPVTISDGTPDWYGLGPVSVEPALQGRGIGSALINEGLSRIRGLGARGCALVGDPGYYRRFDFRNLAELVYEGIPQEFFLCLPFTEDLPQGAVVFHQGFHATA